MIHSPRFTSDLLVLFDIDGTLVRRSGPHHRQALVDAVRTTTGLDTTTEGIPVHGMLDTDIVSQMLSRAGASPGEITAALPKIEETAQSLYELWCPDLRSKICPGSRRLLRRLALAHVPCALVTGNYTRIGWKKLECAGLADFFLFGSFAGTAPTRAALAKNAITEARRRGLIKKQTKIWLIGDAPQDILAARKNQIRCAAVYTGVSTREDLGKLRPARLLRDLRRLSPDDLL